MEANRTGAPAAFVIGLPRSGNAAVLRHLAAGPGWRTLDPPAPEQILSQDLKWLGQVSTDKEVPWLLPQLERCYLRHPGGLTLVRRLFAELLSGRLGRGIIGCDSWAWSYLNYAARAHPPNPLVAQALDHERLSRWMRELAAAGTARRLVFRQADNGAYVTRPSQGTAGGEGAPSAMSDFLKHLATFSLGVPGIAWALWRQALQSRPEDAFSGEPEIDGSPDSQATVWVLPWEKLKRPSIPADLDSNAILILHSLLLHNGLPSEMLIETLPLSSSRLTQALMLLRDRGLIESGEERWQVTASGYPVVRQFLSREGYLTDRF